MSKQEVLIIEDDVQWQRELRRLLEKEGYEISSAVNFTEGVEALKRHTAKVAVVDMSLTSGDAKDRQGLKLAKESRIPVICISGYLTDVEADKLNEDGITPWYFHKKEFKDKKKEFLMAVSDALTRSQEEIHRMWSILEHRFRVGD
jgi:DNA-binding NtrC family response regulator